LACSLGTTPRGGRRAWIQSTPCGSSDTNREC
jgi:hypothetical protein